MSPRDSMILVVLSLLLIVSLCFMGARRMDEKERWEERQFLRHKVRMEMHRVDLETQEFWGNPFFQMQRRVWWTQIRMARMFMAMHRKGV